MPTLHMLTMSLLLMIPFYGQAESNAKEPPTGANSNTVEPSADTLSQEAIDKFWYLGVRGGWANYQDACGTNNTECNDNPAGFGLYGGYQFYSWFALELGITDYGSAEAFYGADKVQADLLDAQLSAKLSYDLSNKLDAYLRLGASYQSLNKESTWAEYDSNNRLSAVSAVGLEYALTTNWSLRGEYQLIDGIGDRELLKADMHFVSLGVTYRFGQSSQPVIKSAAATKNVPVPIVAQRTQRVVKLATISISADALFKFDSSRMTSTAQLSELASATENYTQGTITVIGHTDNLGTVQYNQKLSEKRAQSVANYLQSQGVNPERIIVIGKGELAPIASNATKESRAQNRRVEVKFEESTETETVETIEEVLNNE